MVIMPMDSSARLMMIMSSSRTTLAMAQTNVMTVHASRVASAASCKCIRADYDSSPPSRTQTIMEKIPASGEAGGAGGASSYAALKRLDKKWFQMCHKKSGTSTIPNVITRHSGNCLEEVPKEDVFDVVVCGGTLGIFVAASLLCKGFKVAVVEKGKLQGRVQEWNISRKELDELVKFGILTPETLEDIIDVEFNPNRCGFNGGVEVWVDNILNLGVSPLKLIQRVKDKFLKLGGLVIEGSGLSKADVYNDAAVITLDDEKNLHSRLIIDSMGNFSPIVQQIRSGEQPDGICLVVGTCAQGFDNNSTSDIIYTNKPPIYVGKSMVQIFWEAFPSGSGPRDRTTYLFSYMQVKPDCPSLEELLEIYWDLMPEYQNVQFDELKVLRVLFGIFPTYRSSPLPTLFDRVLQVGDASGIQSPVSFGGFGSLTRHLGRIADGVSEALDSDLLDKDSLALLNPYMPNLSASWLFQKAMSVQSGSERDFDFINTLLATNFNCMQKLGDPVLRPFLQDVIQFGPLAKTLGYVVLSRPDILPSIFRQVGLSSILDFMVHFINLGFYTLLSLFLTPWLQLWVLKLPKKDQYAWKQRFEAWKYGSGLDYNV